jgi:hypothetical protein
MRPSRASGRAALPESAAVAGKLIVFRSNLPFSLRSRGRFTSLAAIVFPGKCLEYVGIRLGSARVEVNRRSELRPQMTQAKSEVAAENNK